jgi:(p)ppGpp synthase/HD superfamily hydrolase
MADIEIVTKWQKGSHGRVMVMSYGPRFEKALVFAAMRHRDQKRKGREVSYVTHLLAAASLVGENHGTEDQVIAALLHDSVEDQGVTRDELVSNFGEEVCRIVMACTDATTRPKPPWRQRKEAHLAHIRVEDSVVKLVVTADKLHNARCILSDLRRQGISVWSIFSAPAEETVWYYRAMYEALAHGWSHPLLDEFCEAVVALEASPRP